MRRVLVTGAGGFIGSHLTELLVKRGFDVKALVRYTSSANQGWLSELDDDVLSNIQVIYGDVRDFHQIKKTMVNCDAVLHLAALIGIPFSYTAPSSYVETNITGTLNILQAARDIGSIHVIQTSTSEVYGTALTVPISESHPLQGQSPYSATKIASDQLALSYYRSFEVPVTVIRPFNTYGPRQSHRAVIPTIISQILRGDGIVRLGSIHPTRDLTFVTDTAAAFVAALVSENGVGEVINVGTGFEISIGNLVEVIARLIGRPVEIVTDDDRIRPPKSEVERLVADAEKASRLLSWSPEFYELAGLERGLTLAINWLENRTFDDRIWKKYQT